EHPLKHPLAKPALCSATVLLLAAAVWAAPPPDKAAPPDPDALVKQLSASSPDDAFEAAMRLDVLLRAGDNASEGAGPKDVAAKVLAAREKFIQDKDVLALLTDDLGKEPVLAARVVVAVVRAEQIVASYKKGGSVAVGRITVEDGKTDPQDVLAQMPI